MPLFFRGQNALKHLNNAKSGVKINDQEPYTSLASKISTP